MRASGTARDSNVPSRSKAFFLEKKKQKAFVRAVAELFNEHATAEQKFFGSFFQKRTASIAESNASNAQINAAIPEAWVVNSRL